MQKETNQNNLVEEFAQIIEKAPIGILYFNSNWEIKHINENLYSFGILDKKESGSLLGKNLLETKSINSLKIKDELLGLAEGIFFEKEIKSVKTIGGGEISIIVKGATLNENEIFSGGILVIEDLRVTADARQDNLFKNDAFEKTLKEYCDFFFITDANFNIKYISSNELGKKLFADKEIINNNITDLFQAASIQNVKQAIDKYSTENRPVVENLPLDQNGNTLTLQLKILPYKPARKSTQLLFIMIKDISLEILERKKHEGELEELKRYQIITSSVSDALIGLDLNGNINFWNKSAELLFDHSRSEVYGKFIGKVIKAFNKKYFDGIVVEIETGVPWQSELKTKNKQGKDEHIAVKVMLMVEENFKSIVMLCSNVTERIEIEKELRTSEERFRNIVLNANEFICNMDLDGKIIFANPSFIKMFEYEEAELRFKFFKDLLDESFDIFKYFNLDDFLKPQAKPIELPCIAKSGKKFFILANFSPVFDYSNQLKYFNGIFSDITEKKEVERHLLMIRSVYEASRDGISVEVNKKIILVNNSFAKIFGYESADQISGMNPLELVAEDDRPRIASYIGLRESREEAPTNFEFIGKRKDGTVFFVGTSVTTYESESNIYIVSVCRDVTERKRAQEALRDSEEKYRSITENIEDFLWTAERIGDRLRSVFYTSTIEKVTGYKQEQFIRDSKLWFKIIYPNDSEFVKNKLKLLLSDSARFSDEIEFRIVNRIGNIVWVRNKINVKRDIDGKPSKIYGLVSDISLSKKAEEDLKKSALQLKELNDAKDKFISIISHDIRTPFSSILGFTEILQSEKNISEVERNQYIGHIQTSSNNMLALVNSLLDWTRLQTGRVKFEPERLNANDIVEKAINIVQGIALKKQIMIQSLVKQNVFIHADADLLLQVFNNLLSNAIKFTKNGGDIVISAHPNLSQNQIQFIVKDSGTGIQKENIEKLFKVETKYTTNGTAGEHGSGLGLSIVHDIVEKHGGKIWVESEYGRSSEFNFTIPVAAVNILLVDDNKTDRLLYTKILKNIIPAYRIDVANNGREAFAILLQATPALIITDHKMPEMSGYDLVKKIMVSDIKGKPPVIVLSADINKNITEEYRQIGVEFIFQKPVNLSSLRTAIEKSLRKALFS
ncbi:MAG: PAS domain S-box protein [Ignavibacteriales bacterium]|nr:PAS domain S-box protein [Ignavibacteriales bacterium]